MTEASSSMVVGLLGTADSANYGDVVSTRVTERELARRLPQVEFRRLAPFGWEHPTATDAAAAEPVGRRSPERLAEIANQLDALVVGGGEIGHIDDARYGDHYGVDPHEVLRRRPGTWFIEGVGADNEDRCPTLWHGVGVPFTFEQEMAKTVRAALDARAYVSVRDIASRKRVEATGTHAEVLVVPDATFVVDRLLPPAVLRRRRSLHELMGWRPAGRYLVVQGNRSMLAHVDQICSAIDAALTEHPELSIVTIKTGSNHGDSEFSTALADRFQQPVWSMPPNLLVEDLASVIAGADAVLATSMHATITAVAFRTGAVILDFDRQLRLTALGEQLAGVAGYVTGADGIPAALHSALAGPHDGQLLRDLQNQLDDHFDRMATVIERRSSATDAARAGRRSVAVAAELAALRRAHGVRGRQLSSERAAMAIAWEASRDASVTLEAQRRAAQQMADSALSVLAGRDATIAGLRGRAAMADNEILQLHSRIRELDAQLHLTERALDEVHRTKTMRTVRYSRMAYGWLTRSRRNR